MSLTAIALNCTLKADPAAPSSTDAMIEVLRGPFEKAGVTITETVRVAALTIKPGVTSDEGEGDDWPALRTNILAHDILIFAGPIWMGQVGSVAKRVLERMDAFLDETDDKGRMPSWSKVAVAAIVGNEDAPTCRRRRSSRRSTMSAGRSRRSARCIGSARPMAVSTSRT